MYRIHIAENIASSPVLTVAKVDQELALMAKMEAEMAVLAHNRELIGKSKEQEEKYRKMLLMIKEKKSQLIKDSKVFTFKDLAEWLATLDDPSSTAAGLAMQNFQMNVLDRDPKKANILQNRCYDIALPPVIPCNQWFSGRCWMFAGLNILRPYFIAKYNLGPDFELSQAYLFFWHYLEQYEAAMNLFYYEEMSEEEKSMRLSSPLSDGGNWITFRRLVVKYGIVPKKSYGDSWQTKNSKEMNKRMSEMLAKDLKACVDYRNSNQSDASGQPSEKYKEFLKQCLQRVERVLTLCMGKPPVGPVVIQCKPKTPSTVPQQRTQESTFLPVLVPLRDGLYASPQAMFEEVDAMYEVCKHVQLINDPRKEEGKVSSTAAPVWYKTQHQQLRATPELLLNMRTDDIANIIVQSIQKKIGVWFACNVNEDFSTKLQGMTHQLFRPDHFLDVDLDMSKEDRMRWGRAHCNHAMLITGVQFERDECGGTQSVPHIGDGPPAVPRIAAFQVQNSWGATGPGKGFYKMTKDWFDMHCHTFVVRHELIPNLPDRPPDADIEEFQYYDFFG
mgnify:FL=1